jgi:hypothetical protein
MTTREELQGMTNEEIVKEYGITGTAARGNKASLIALALGEDNEPAPEKTVPEKSDKAKEKKSATMPRIEVRSPETKLIAGRRDATIFTPLGKGKWRIETTGDGGTGEVDGGIDATWDGTTLVLGNVTQDANGNAVWFDPAMAPVIEEGDDEGT